MNIKRLIYVFLIVLVLGMIVKNQPASPQEASVCDFVAATMDTMEVQALTIRHLQVLLKDAKSEKYNTNKDKIQKVIDDIDKKRTFYRKVFRANCGASPAQDV
jgi:hypothetical protein